MGLAGRRKALGYSQEELACSVGVDRTTVGRWESGKIVPQPSQRRRLAEALAVDIFELDTLVTQRRAEAQQDATPTSSGYLGSGDTDDMIRREFLRVLAISGALTALSMDEAQALTEGGPRAAPADFAQMNGHLWQVYLFAQAKGSVYPVVRDQLSVLTDTLGRSTQSGSKTLCGAAGDLFQLAGELAFDSDRYMDAAASYSLAASASKDAGAYDLWACALVRHAYLDMSEHRYREAAQILSAAERVADRGDSELSTRHWVASVQAEAYAGLGDLTACERALDRAERVRDLGSESNNGGWLRFDGSRLAEERGSRYVKLGQLDLAEEALKGALEQDVLSAGQSFRRRGAVLAALASIGARRGDVDQVLTFGREALTLAGQTSSGYVARRLQDLRAGFGPLTQDRRIAELGAEIGALSAVR